jgi:oxygen-independent coproporphyrinogen-3 oxidase
VKLPINPNATIYFGGGTPSTLPIECVSEIVGALKNHKYWQEPAEATIEVNPGTADLEKLKALRYLGFDRISFGVQSLNDVELKTIGRIHSAQEALQAIAWAKEAGFNRISADLIYGLPGQTLTSLRKTLEELTATGIEHVSVYGLIVEEGTPLAKLVDEGKLVLPEEDIAADMYEFVQSFLKEQGFERYEISNYAKKGQYSKHNLVYWKYEPYAAFGAAAEDREGRAGEGNGTVFGVASAAAVRCSRCRHPGLLGSGEGKSACHPDGDRSDHSADLRRGGTCDQTDGEGR